MAVIPSLATMAGLTLLYNTEGAEITTIGLRKFAVRIQRALRRRRKAATTIARELRRLINQMRLHMRNNQGPLGLFLRPGDIRMLHAFGTYRREPPAAGFPSYIQLARRGSERWPYIRPYIMRRSARAIHHEAAMTITRAMRRLILNMREALRSIRGGFLRPEDRPMLTAYGGYLQRVHNPPLGVVAVSGDNVQGWPYIY